MTRNRFSWAKMNKLRDNDEKRCPRCDEVKHLDDFYNNINRNDGKDHLCKECRRLNSMEFYLENKFN